MSRKIKPSPVTKTQDNLTTLASSEKKALRSENSQSQTPKQEAYFIEAQNWADDLYTMALTSRNRYQAAFFVALSLVILLALALNALIPLQHLEPLLIHHYPGGQVSVQPIDQRGVAPTQPAQVESDIVRYVIQRESFDATSYHAQYELVHLLSSKEVAKQYTEEQSRYNQQSPLQVLGRDGTRTVHIESVIFLDSALKNQSDQASKTTHYNLAQVNFHISDHLSATESSHTLYRTALISWAYRGTPTNPSERWKNWDGFTITRYTVAQRNL